jgi:hypothetical protein
VSDAVPTEIELFFDPTCPWTWNTSRWLLDAAAQRQVEVRYRSLSLQVLNAGRDIPERFRAGMEASGRAHRLFAALRADGRNDLIGAVYTEWGRRHFHDGEAPSLALVRASADAAGAAAWLGAVDDARWDADIEASTREAVELAGPDVGSPVLVFDEPRIGLFGPVVSPPPSGPPAAALLDVVVAGARTPGFLELKRGRSGPPAFGARP